MFVIQNIAVGDDTIVLFAYYWFSFFCSYLSTTCMVFFLISAKAYVNSKATQNQTLTELNLTNFKTTFAA